MLTATGFVAEAELAKRVSAVAAAFPGEVVHIRYSPDTDWSGDPSINFRIMLTDEASREDRLHRIARAVSDRLIRETGVEEVGLRAYFNFRNESEQAVLRNPEWD